MIEARPYRLVRERDLPAYAGLRRTQIAELIKRGEFPRPIKLSDGGRAKAWLEESCCIGNVNDLLSAIQLNEDQDEHNYL